MAGGSKYDYNLAVIAGGTAGLVAVQSVIARIEPRDSPERYGSVGVDVELSAAVTARGKRRILGVTIVGPGAGELLGEFNLAMKAGPGLGRIMGVLHPYPTLSEASWFTAIQWCKERAPARVFPLLEFLQRIRR